MCIDCRNKTSKINNIESNKKNPRTIFNPFGISWKIRLILGLLLIYGIYSIYNHLDTNVSRDIYIIKTNLQIAENGLVQYY